MPRPGPNIKRTKTGRWQASYRKLDGREVSKTFDRRTDAARWRRDGIAARERPGEYLDPKAGRITVRDRGERHHASQLHHRVNTRRLAESVLRLHVYPHLGDMPMNRVTRADVQALVKRWEADGAAASTIRTRYALVRSLFLAAVRDDVIRRSPCVGVNLPEVVAERPVPLTARQVEQLGDAIEPRYRAMVLLAYGCGPRLGEARGLTLPHVDFLGREVAFTQQLGDRPPYPLVPL
jgi:integrase